MSIKVGRVSPLPKLNIDIESWKHVTGTVFRPGRMISMGKNVACTVFMESNHQIPKSKWPVVNIYVKFQDYITKTLAYTVVTVS